MKSAPIPNNETNRINNLYSYKILDSLEEKEYDQLVELASQICNCPIALISLVDKDRQWFKAKKNLEASETTRDIAFCAHTILQEDVMVISDAKTDERFHDNPLVAGELNVGFYAGAPIVSSDGYKLGTVCVIDHMEKNDLTSNQKSALKIIANQVSKLLELRIKNKKIIKTSKQLISAEKKLAQLTLIENDIKNASIAYELHENIAQTLVALKINLEAIGTSGVDINTHIEKSLVITTLLIEETTSLSKYILPTTCQDTDYYSLIRDYCNDFGLKNKMKISIGKEITIKSKDNVVGVNLFRIIQNQLDILINCRIYEIKINLKIIEDSSIQLKMTFDNNLIDKTNSSVLSLLNNSKTRVKLLNGTIKEKMNGSKIKISIPF
jgi:hypothetical protein